jgi:predicted acylesterase/phospholipase RssA
MIHFLLGKDDQWSSHCGDAYNYPYNLNCNSVAFVLRCDFYRFIRSCMFCCALKASVKPQKGFEFGRASTLDTSSMPLPQSFGMRSICRLKSHNALKKRISDSVASSVVSTPKLSYTNSVASSQGVDIVLSSGFLAFASHCGFLQAVRDVGLNVRGVMGTSSGALTGSLFAAGYSPEEIAREFSKLPPIERIKLSREPWKGVFSLDPATKRLQELLPETFEGLELEFGVGVVSPKGYEIIDTGCLAEAVVASAAVPILFNPVRIPGRRNVPHIDGGIKTRVGLDVWRAHQVNKFGLVQSRPAAVHVVGRSSPFSGNDTVEHTGPDDIAIVMSPKSKSSLWDLSKFDKQFEETYATALPILQNFSIHMASQ